MEGLHDNGFNCFVAPDKSHVTLKTLAEHEEGVLMITEEDL